jgi:cell division protein FtsL
MLDTRMTPISARPRRSPGSARPEARSNVRPLAERTAGAARTARREQAAREWEPAAREVVSAEPIRRALPSARQSRLARSEMRLMGLATACTGIVCALLLLYLAAYAHVTQLGIEQAQARGQLRQNQVRSELLQAERNSLESPQRIIAAAMAQGMTARGGTPVNYITANQNDVQQNGAEFASDSDQGSRSGTTEDSSSAASLHH